MRIRNKIAKHRLSVFTWAFVAIFVSVLPVRAVAADVSVHASIDSLALWMGEQTRIRLEVAQNEGEQVMASSNLFRYAGKRYRGFGSFAPRYDEAG